MIFTQRLTWTARSAPVFERIRCKMRRKAKSNALVPLPRYIIQMNTTALMGPAARAAA